MIVVKIFEKDIQTKEISINEVPKYISLPKLTWIRCTDLSNEDVRKILTNVKEIPDFIINDCITKQRPRMYDYENFIHIIFKYMKLNSGMKSTQINLILGKNFLLTISADATAFKGVDDDLKKKPAKIKEFGLGWVVHTILDRIVDSYYLVVDKIDDEIDKVEKDVGRKNDQETINKIILLRKYALRMRRNIIPEKEIMRSLGRDAHVTIDEEIMIYLRDTFNDLLAVNDRVENQRELLSGLTEVYISNVSYNLNIVMKTLTVLTTLILVPTLIVGIYGMNLRFLPFADHEFGFYILLAIILSSVAFLLIAFRRKGWI